MKRWSKTCEAYPTAEIWARITRKERSLAGRKTQKENKILKIKNKKSY
jgi:hypothetical protein